MSRLLTYFGIFSLPSMLSELLGFGKDILWWVTTRSTLEKVIASIGMLIVVIKIFTINSSPQSVLPLMSNLFLQIIVLSYLMYISSMYWFIKAYKYKLTLLLENRQSLHDFVTKLKEKSFFRITPTKLIADGKTNSNELEVITAIYIPQKAQIGSMHRYVLYIIFFSLAEFMLSAYVIFFISAIMVITYIHMTFFDNNAIQLILESFRKSAQALYNYHAYNPKKCKKFIEGSKDPILKQLEILYQEVIANA